MDGVYVIFILVEHHLSFFFYFYILEELYLMVHTFIIQILGFQELFHLYISYLISFVSVNPLHIVPEWYFLCQYAMLKAVPNKNSGFIILLTSILLLFIMLLIINMKCNCYLLCYNFQL